MNLSGWYYYLSGSVHIQIHQGVLYVSCEGDIE